MPKHAMPTKILIPLICQLAIWLLSVTASLAVGFVGMLLVIIIFGYGYELHHPIPIGEDDLGLGLMVVLWGGMALLLAIPFMFWLSCRIYRFITKVFSKTEHGAK